MKIKEFLFDKILRPVGRGLARVKEFVENLVSNTGCMTAMLIFVIVAAIVSLACVTTNWETDLNRRFEGNYIVINNSDDTFLCLNEDGDETIFKVNSLFRFPLSPDQKSALQCKLVKGVPLKITYIQENKTEPRYVIGVEFVKENPTPRNSKGYKVIPTPGTEYNAFESTPLKGTDNE